MIDRLDYEYDSVQGAEIRKKLRHKPSWYMTETDNFWVSCEMGERAQGYCLENYSWEKAVDHILDAIDRIDARG